VDSFTPASPTEIEEIAPYLRLEWFSERRIVAFVVGDLPNVNLRSALDVWIGQIERMYREWPAEQPLLIVQDLSASQSSIIANPYFKGRLQELVTLHVSRAAIQAMAMVLPRNTMTHLTRLIARPEGQEALRQNYFFTRDDAVRWLLSLHE
jgi:hypothetical protein